MFRFLRYFSFHERQYIIGTQRLQYYTIYLFSSIVDHLLLKMAHVHNIIFHLGVLIMTVALCTATPIADLRELLEEFANEQQISRRSSDQCPHASDSSPDNYRCPSNYHPCVYDSSGPVIDGNGYHWCCDSACRGSNGYDRPGCSSDCFFTNHDCGRGYHCCPNGGHGDSRCGGRGCCSNCWYGPC